MTIKDLYTFCHENNAEINLRIYKFEGYYECTIRVLKGSVKYETQIRPLALVDCSDDSIMAQLCDILGV